MVYLVPPGGGVGLTRVDTIDGVVDVVNVVDVECAAGAATSVLNLGLFGRPSSMVEAGITVICQVELIEAG